MPFFYNIGEKITLINPTRTNGVKIAEKLGLSPFTVVQYGWQLRKKLNVYSRQAAVIVWQEGKSNNGN